MKNILLILVLVWSATKVTGQVVENVYFNNYNSAADNDFVNYFDGGTGMIVNIANGITGGCMEMPNTINWGNDNAVYCSKYVGGGGISSNTRISFKYDTTQINTVNFDRAVSIFLRPSADFNHYVIASVTHDKKIQILTYSWTNNPVVLNLQHNHWYEFILSTGFINSNPPYQINLSAMVNDLGISGQFPPIPAGTSNGVFYDSLLFADPAIEVSVSAALWGGGKYLDNFRYEGTKSADSCLIPIGINDVNDLPISIVFTDDNINITHAFSRLEIEIYSLTGALITNGDALNGSSQFPITNIKNGLYILRLRNYDNPGNPFILNRKFSISGH